MTTPAPPPPERDAERAARSAVRRALDAHTDAFTALLSPVVAAVREFLAAVAAAIFRDRGVDLDQYPNDAQWEQIYDRHVDPVAEQVFRDAARWASGGLAEGTFARVAVDDDAGNLPVQVWEQISAAVHEGIDAGEDALRIAARVEQVLADPQWTEWRAERLARTEATGQLNAGTLAGALSRARADGTVSSTRKQWLGTPDERIRDTHRAAHGQVVGLLERFTVGDAQLLIPADPAAPAEERVNCRCSFLIIRPGMAPLALTAHAGGIYMCNCSQEMVSAVLTAASVPVSARCEVRYGDGQTRPATVTASADGIATLLTDDGAEGQLPWHKFAIVAEPDPAHEVVTAGAAMLPLDPQAFQAAIAAGVVAGLRGYAQDLEEIRKMAATLREGRPGA